MELQKISLSFLVLTIAGCVLSPPTEVATITAVTPMQETARFLEKQTKECWERSAGFWEDGITIDARMSLYDTALVSAARWASDIGIQDPFLVVEVMSEPDGSSRIVISEGDYACGLDGDCDSLELHKDVVRWLAGDTSCREDT